MSQGLWTQDAKSCCFGNLVHAEPQMLRVRSVSGEVLVTIELASFLNTLAAGSHPVRALKQHLCKFCGQPRFRQRLVVWEDGVALNDNEEHILKPGDVQLVLLNLSLASEVQTEELRRAAESGLISVVETILQQPQDPDLGNPAPLFIASHHGHLEVACLLLEARADKDKANNIGATPLVIAAESGHLEVARLLLEANADKEKATDVGATPLFLAALNGYLEVARLLLEATADKDKAMNNGATPLFVAAQNGHLEVALLLLEVKADKDKAMNDGATPLRMAAQKGQIQVARCLLEAKADKDKARLVALPLCSSQLRKSSWIWHWILLEANAEPPTWPRIVLPLRWS